MSSSVISPRRRSREAAVCPHLVGRLRLSGTTPFAWRVWRDLDLLAEEAKDRASVIGRCWIEKVEVDCNAPSLSAGPATNPIAELRVLIGHEVIRSDAYQAEVEKIAEELRSQLPQGCRGILGLDEASAKDAIANLVREGANDVLARLQAANVEEVG